MWCASIQRVTGFYWMVAMQTSPLQRSCVVQRMDGADIPAIAYELQQEEKGNPAGHGSLLLQTRNEDGHARRLGNLQRP